MMRRFPFTDFFDPNKPQQQVEIREGRWVNKVLTGRDIGNGQLIMPKDEFEEYILSQLPPEMKTAIEGGEHVPVSVRDIDTSTTEEVTLWRNSANSYVLTKGELTKGWKDSFVKPRSLEVGETVGLRWVHEEAALLFTVTSRAE